MIFIITCLDKPGVLDKRMACLQPHMDYMSTDPINTLLSGPLVGADGKTAIGSFFMVEADSKDDVLAFQKNDPMYQAGIWDTVIVEHFIKRVDTLSGSAR